MNNERYNLVTNPALMRFTFQSTGLKGNTQKAVEYTPAEVDGLKFYNLGFGDVNEITGELDDLSITNNGDREKILSTVAATVLHFTEHMPGALVYAEGSTLARTRLYQMALRANLQDIIEVLEIYGLVDGVWFPFKENVNYEAFMVLRKY
jgi:hypothetical protein